MHTLPHRTQIFTLSIATVALLLASNLATADIYKWRNNRGVIQYSDKPPVSGFTKASQHEIVNSLQSKDMCAEPNAKTAAAAARKIRDRKSTRLNSSHRNTSRMPSSA